MPILSLSLELTTIDHGHARKSPTADIHDLLNILAKVAPHHPVVDLLCHVLWYSYNGDSPTLLVCNHSLYHGLILHCFHRPIYKGVRMSPAGLHKYHGICQYLEPGCLCPLLELFSEQPIFTEAAIYLTTFGHYEEEYIAECARGCCEYLGQSLFSLFKKSKHLSSNIAVPLERIFLMYRVSVGVFPPRG